MTQEEINFTRDALKMHEICNKIADVVTNLESGDDVTELRNLATTMIKNQLDFENTWGKSKHSANQWDQYAKLCELIDRLENASNSLK